MIQAQRTKTLIRVDADHVLSRYYRGWLGRMEVMSEEVEDRGQCKRGLRSNGGDVLGISSN